MSTPWEVRFSNSRQLPYFFNAQTSQSTWDAPAELTPEQVNALPGASKHLLSKEQAPPGQVRASHILAKHTGSRRPSSWREATITRSPEEARKIIEAHIETLKGLSPAELPKEFAKIAAQESDCSSARKGGDLGWFGRGMMQRAFEDATYAIDVNQLSPVVETESGIHVILRTG
ncbi:peptidyl-prolyl cis-trans isomerase NIMA-interacting 1, partial [Tremellales sp. Uapishka_1]